ncbi:MAG: sulfatase-like hydrolase/transferase [Planctomycetales bacterium]
MIGWSVCFLFVCCFSTLSAAERPNLLFVVTDDQRWDTIRALGNSQISTPTQDALVRRGTVFSNAYCMGSMSGAVCIPSRTMLMTGKSVWRIPPQKTKPYNDPTLGKSFRQAGYDTFFCGKRNNSFFAANEDFETVVYDESRGETNKLRDTASQFVADTTINWLNKHPAAETPFCIYLGPPVPHDPRVAPPEFMQMYDPAKILLPKSFLPQHSFDNGELQVRDELLAPHPRLPEEMKKQLAEYYATITCFDHHLGRIIDLIRERGQLDNTLVVYTSDHGLAVGGMHGLMGKQNLYEHNKPPLILAGPGIPAGKKSDALVYLYDLFPTVCEGAGIAMPQGIEGKSLWPTVQGKSDGVRETLFTAYKECQRAVRDNRWKLIRYHAAGEYHTQLYDLQSDPEELKNLADEPQFANERQRLEKLLTQSRKDFADPIDFDKDLAAKK